MGHDAVFLIVWPIFVVAFMGAFAALMMYLTERDFRRSTRASIGSSRQRCTKMRAYVARADEQRAGTANGVAVANRLIMLAEMSISDAEKILAALPCNKESWRSASKELSTAKELLDKVPAAIADAPATNV